MSDSPKTWPSLGERGQQPERDPRDDELVLQRVDDKLSIVVRERGSLEPKGEIVISLRNAWTLIGILSFFVGLKLPASIARRIHL